MPATVSPAFTFSGVATSLGKKLVAASTSFSATLDSIAGINNVAWSIVGTDETTTAGSYTLTPSGTKGETVTFTSGAAGTAGILSCTVNGGVDPQTGSPSTTMTGSAKWYVALADGGEVGCVNETTQSNATFGHTGIVNTIARRLSGLGTTVSLSAITVPATATFAYSQAQKASGTGNTATFTGQRGATGANIGGGFTFITGASGDGSTPSGNFRIDLGTESGGGNESGRTRWVSAGATLDLYSLSTVWQFTTASGIVIKATGAASAKLESVGGSVTASATAITVSAGNLGLNGGASFGTGTGVVSVANAAVDPSTNPTGGGILFASGGAGKWRGSSGTVTTFGPAEPHCATCDRDFAHEWTNDRSGEHLAVCVPCMIAEMAKAGINTAAFAFVNTLKQ